MFATADRMNLLTDRVLFLKVKLFAFFICIAVTNASMAKRNLEINKNT